MLMVVQDLGNSIYLLFFDLSDWLMVKGPSAKNAFNKAPCLWSGQGPWPAAESISQVLSLFPSEVA